MNVSFKGDFIEHENQIYSSLSMKNNNASSIMVYER